MKNLLLLIGSLYLSGGMGYDYFNNTNYGRMEANWDFEHFGFTAGGYVDRYGFGPMVEFIATYKVF